MGFFDKAKGFFNIGGVTVKISGVPPTIAPRGTVNGRITVTTESDKEILSTKVRLTIRRTKFVDGERETQDRTEVEQLIGEPFSLKAGETRVIDFGLDYAAAPLMRDLGGLAGGIGKVADVMTNNHEEHFVVAICDVKGTALDPSDRAKVTVVA